MTRHTSERIVIVGGGVAGLAVAARLAQVGLPVTVLEAARLGHGTSTRNQGWLHSGAWFAPQQPEVARLCYESLQQTLWFCPECVEADPSPMTYVLSQPQSDPARWTTAWQAAGIPFQPLSREGVVERHPELAISQVQHAFELPDRSMQIDLLLKRLAEVAQQAGAEIRTQSPVTGLIQRANSVQGVEIGDERLAARLVILAGNASGGALLPGFGARPLGPSGESALVALKTHLVSVRPGVGRWPLCVADAEGFNHLPHHPYSVFGNCRWLTPRHGEDDRVDAAEVERLRNQVARFFPNFQVEDHQVTPWAGVTAQVMRKEQIATGQVPVPMVIDYERESDRIANLLSIFPGRATLWAHLAETASAQVQGRLGMRQRDVAAPPWLGEAAPAGSTWD